MRIINKKVILKNIFDQLLPEEKKIVESYLGFIDNDIPLTGVLEEMIEKIIAKYRPEIFETSN